MLGSAGLLIWWVWTSALPFYLFARKKTQLHTPASSFWALEDLAGKEIAGSWLLAGHTVTFDPWLCNSAEKGWAYGQGGHGHFSWYCFKCPLFIYLFTSSPLDWILTLEREEGTERETSIGSLPYAPWLGIELTTEVCALIRDQTCNLLVYGVTLQLSHLTGAHSCNLSEWTDWGGTVKSCWLS